jgi:lipoprotein-anchoring transpeptidase ErfK/SrfK
MRKAILLSLGIAAMAVAGSTATNAAVKSYWDQASGKWMKYDTESRRVMPASPGSAGATTNMGRTASFRGSPIARKTIDYDGPFHANTIIINTSERRLYYVFEEGRALKYGVGVGREGFQWAGVDRISRKAEWPGWTPPPEMIARERKKGRILPAYMPGGPRNPLGARALYIGGTLYRIHGSNEPWSIGQAVSSGCIRLTNEDVTHLYERVKVGTRVVVLRGDESAAKLIALANPPVEKKAVAVADARVKDDVLIGIGVAIAGTVPSEAAAMVTETASVTPVEEAPAATAAVAPEARAKDDAYVAVAPVAAPAQAEATVVPVEDTVTTASTGLPVDTEAKDDTIPPAPSMPVASAPEVPVVPTEAPAAMGDATPLDIEAKDDGLSTEAGAKDDDLPVEAAPALDEETAASNTAAAEETTVPN